MVDFFDEKNNNQWFIITQYLKVFVGILEFECLQQVGLEWNYKSLWNALL